MISKGEMRSLPKIRHKANKPIDDFKQLDRQSKKELIAKYQEHLKVTLHKPEPKKVKQVDLEDKLPQKFLNYQITTLPSQ